MKLKKVLSLILVLIMAIGLFTACGDSKQGNADGKTKDKKQVFQFSSNSEVLGLNPMINTTGPDNGAQQYFYETLIRFVADEKGDAVYKMAVAEDYKITDEGKTYTFMIRDNAKWSDGVPVSAKDFEYTFKTMAKPETASTNAWLFEGVIDKYYEALYEGGSLDDIGVKALDDKTLEFRLVKPCGYFLDLLTGAMPVRQDIHEKYGDTYGSSVDKTIFNGPYVITELKTNVEMVLVKNEHYWDAANVTLDRIERKIITEPGTAAQALINGDIDVVGASEKEWRQLIENEGRFNNIITTGTAPEFLGFNCSNKYFKNEKIRLAFSLAIDREKYVADLRENRADPIYALVTPDTMCGEKPYRNLIKGEPEIVKELQKKYTDLKALLIEGLKEEGLDPDPAKMQVEYTTRGTNEFSKKSAEWLIQVWKEKLGVDVLIDMIEWNVMWDRVDKGDYDICTSGWGPYYNDPNALLGLFHPKDGFFDSNKSGWKDKDADRFAELLDLASNELDQNKRAEYFFEAEQLLVGKGVIAPTYLGFGNTYLAKYVQRYYTNPRGNTDMRYVFTAGKPGMSE